MTQKSAPSSDDTLRDESAQNSDETPRDESAQDSEPSTLNADSERQSSVANWGAVAIVVATVAVAMSAALAPDFSNPTTPWFIVAAAYLGLGVWALVYFKRRGQLGPLLKPRYGDTSIGIVLGLVLAAIGVLVQRSLVPDGSHGAAWLYRIYLRAGEVQTDGTLIGLLILLALLEEIVWRGMVLERLLDQRPRFAPALCAVLYAIAVSPTFLLLADPIAGSNPLVVLAALGTGLVWSYARIATQRLTPIVISHVVFTYFMAAPLPGWFF